MEMNEDQIESMTIAMLNHVKGQNIGVSVGAALNVLMTLYNHAPKEFRGSISHHMRMMADTLEAMDGVKQ
jgi:hypothetical protein